MTLYSDEKRTVYYIPVTGTFGVEDLSIKRNGRWEMTRWQMWCLGWRCIRAALEGKP